MIKEQKGYGRLAIHKMESVQALRGAAALFVICQHVCFLQRGSFGVDLFFLISGFVVMLSTEKSTDHFLGKRAVRILPLYWTLTIAVWGVLIFFPNLFENTKGTFWNLCRSLSFIPFSQDGVTQPVVRVGWTINYEVEFYVLFWLSMRLSMRFRALICSGVLAGLTAIGALLPKLPEPFAFWTDSRIMEFALGMGLFYVVRAITDSLCRGREDAEATPAARGREGAEATPAARGRKDAEATHTAPAGDATKSAGGLSGYAGWYAALILVSAAVFFYEWKSYELVRVCRLPEVIRWGLPSAALFLLFAAAGMRVRMPRLPARIGDMSFSLYLLHYYPMQFLNRALRHTAAPNMREALTALAALAAVMLASWLSYVWIEKKIGNYLRSRLLS